ncbi:hypothetical protein [Hymenobacter glacieicola]|uniref:Uncharacterized protein n=1 Tax=Hymenobacter glacieicola TaxID=1562124 RepID=A0ABQ1X9W7_9BACT|nr:hypothetical protein [Hymenobacter glacieicola]GGG62459.1 hypothetical protein GCM10011378_43240 [Hymenobacter glacieicola]
MSDTSIMQPESSLTETSISKTAPEIGLTEAQNGKTGPESNFAETSSSNTGGENSESERLTNNKAAKKGGRPPKPTSSTAVTWSIRGVERETRAIIEKAAERTGKTLGQYLNDDVRSFAQGQLTQAEATGQAVASPRDLQVQVEQLTQMVEGIAARLAEPERKGFWQRVFGK